MTQSADPRPPGPSAPIEKFERVDAIVEQAIDLSPEERKELIDTLLFYDMVKSSD